MTVVPWFSLKHKGNYEFPVPTKLLWAYYGHWRCASANVKLDDKIVWLQVNLLLVGRHTPCANFNEPKMCPVLQLFDPSSERYHTRTDKGIARPNKLHESQSKFNLASQCNTYCITYFKFVPIIESYIAGFGHFDIDICYESPNRSSRFHFSLPLHSNILSYSCSCPHGESVCRNPTIQSWSKISRQQIAYVV